jgi:outer membrane immunogenic protein
MRKLLLASVAFTALAMASAQASDMPPSRSMPPPRAPTYVPFFSWNGFYLGVNGGYGWGRSNWTGTATGVTTGDFDLSGALVGGTLGFNLQTGGMVLGVEADMDWSDIKGSTTVNCLSSCETANAWLGTVRGRLGYGLDRFLPYLTGGIAIGRVKSTVSGTGSASDTNVGWTAGGGLEYAFIGSWSAKLEYLYVDLGKSTCDATCSGATPFDLEFQSHLVRAGLNYKF